MSAFITTGVFLLPPAQLRCLSQLIQNSMPQIHRWSPFLYNNFMLKDSNPIEQGLCPLWDGYSCSELLTIRDQNLIWGVWWTFQKYSQYLHFYNKISIASFGVPDISMTLKRFSYQLNRKLLSTDTKSWV